MASPPAVVVMRSASAFSSSSSGSPREHLALEDAQAGLEHLAARADEVALLVGVALAPRTGEIDHVVDERGMVDVVQGDLREAPPGVDVLPEVHAVADPLGRRQRIGGLLRADRRQRDGCAHEEDRARGPPEPASHRA
jgi:hypothetical protein